MFEGGISYNRDSDKAVRYIALLGTPVFAGYSLLAMAGIIDSSNYVSHTVTIVISGLWVATGLYHFFAPIRSRLDMFWRLTLYHVLTLATILFITGFFQPFASSVALLFLAANIYFGRTGLRLSMLSVLLAAVIDTIVRYPTNPSILNENILGTIVIMIFGLALLMVISAQETHRQALISSQRQERLQYDRIVTIINNLTDATFSTDANGKVLMYNAACLNLLDTNISLKGKDISSLFNITDANNKPIKLHDIMSEAKTATRRNDLRHTYADGEQIRLELTFAPIRSSYSRSRKASNQVGYVIIIRDVTKEKSLEEERDEFISVVSHELRTPITIVEGTLSNAQLMMKRPKLPDNQTIIAMVDDAHEQVLYLAKMVNDLSTLSRAERGVADTAEDIDITEMIHKLHNQYQKDAESKKLRLDLDLSPKLGTIRVSRLYVEELLQNFITNSIKYTKEGSVTIIVKQSKDKVRFTVKDTGIGISRSDQAKIFNKFYRSEDYRIRETNGTGLGLYVSSKLAHKLNTHIELTSRLNHGSAFSFELPAKAK